MKYTEILNADGTPPYWWHWKNFTPKEVSCSCGCDEIWQGNSKEPPKWFLESMDAIQMLRYQWGKAIKVNSGHRCKTHNKGVRGVANSKHLTHIAFDCPCYPDQQTKFANLAQNAQFHYIKIYIRRNFVHMDIFPRSKDWLIERDYGL